MLKKLGMVFSVLIGTLFLFFLLGGAVVYFFASPLWLAKNAVGVVEIKGGIYEPQETLNQLREFRKAKGIAGVIVRIDSPGGTVAASQELFEAIRELSSAKPVVASLGSVAASGGYYAACGAQKIIANPGTITGSIGVKVEHVSVGDLLEWAKIHHETLKSGEFKDTLSLHQALSPAEKTLIEELLSEIHTQFKQVVAASRHIPLEKLGGFADGRILSGEQALALGLVDLLGGFSAAVQEMQNLLKMKEEPELIFADKTSPWWTRLLESKADFWNVSGPVLRFLYQM